MRTEPAGATHQEERQNDQSLWLRYLRFIIFCVGLILISTWFRYQYQDQEQRTSKLLKSLKSLHTRNLFLSAERIKRERLEHIEAQVTKLHLPLVRSTEPPFLIVDTLQSKDNQ